MLKCPEMKPTTERLATAAVTLMLGLCEPSGAAGPETPVSVTLCNNQRTGHTKRSFAPPYRAAWVYASQHKPRPAWKEPVWEVQRIDLDYAYGTAVGDGLAYFGSSADHSVRALHLETGQEKWTFFTGGPVRLAPAVGKGKVYFGSDDGYVYCLEGSTGKLVGSSGRISPTND